MLQIRQIFKSYVDGVMVLLFFFAVTLGILFFYLQNVDKYAKNYYLYKKTVEKLLFYHYELDSVFIRSYRYLNHDKITAVSRSFEKEMNFLKKNPLTEDFGAEVQNGLYAIIEQYNQKLELIERFKTLNARITGVVSYLKELNKEIHENHHISMELEQLLTDILYAIGQVFVDADIDLNTLEEHLGHMAKHIAFGEDIAFFYRHVEQFLSDARHMKRVLEERKTLKLDQTIEALNDLLEKEYLSNQRKEEQLGLVFFLFAFIILVFLIRTYANIVKNRQKIYYLAYHDTLTNLPNRTEFERYTASLIERCQKEDCKFAILFVDLDRFKVINDTLGHDIGDQMLVILSQRISSVLNAQSLLSRIGGDEFVVILHDMYDMTMIEVYVDRIIAAIRRPIRIKEYSLTITASIGIARYPEDGEDKNTLLKHADSAMYFAKSKGSDTHAFYTKQLSVDTQRRLELEQELAHALKYHQFSLMYQPQYDLQRQDIVGIEALIRWNNDLLGAVSPEEFIAVAEDTGMIIELGYFIFEEACKTFVYWRDQGVEIGLIAINISSVQLRQIDILERFQEIMERTGIDPSCIELELTERYIMEYATEKLTVLDKFRQLGCRISIDDFGTGYSSLSYLKHLPIDTIKIDKSFIPDSLHEQSDIEVVRAIILLSKSLGYSVIAEGIETQEQENMLKSLHCDMGQGYYFAKPMSRDDVVTFYGKKMA